MENMIIFLRDSLINRRLKKNSITVIFNQFKGKNAELMYQFLS